jgi:flagellum-specific ATP synthase
MATVADHDHKAAAGKLKNIMATYNEAEDLINIGAYKKGSNPNIDKAIDKIDQVNEFLLQDAEDKYSFEETVKELEDLFE